MNAINKPNGHGRDAYRLTGADTVASGVGRGEYTDASVRPHAFWL